MRLLPQCMSTGLLFGFLLFGLVTNSLWAQQLQCEPCRHGFHKVQVGGSSSFSIELTNTGHKWLRISADYVQGSAFSIGAFHLPMKLGPGKSIQLPVIFTPVARGRTRGSITLVNTGQDSRVTVRVAGTGMDQGSHSVYLYWDPGDGDAAGYNIYRGTANGGPYKKVNSGLDTATAYTDYTVESGTTYYYVTTEVNAQGEEGAYSNIAQAIIPDP